MSIDSVEYDGPVVLRCDGDQCNTFLEFSSFNKAVAFKKKQKEKENGWRSALVNCEWKDFCPSCTAKYVKGE